MVYALMATKSASCMINQREFNRAQLGTSDIHFPLGKFLSGDEEIGQQARVHNQLLGNLDSTCCHIDLSAGVLIFGSRRCISAPKMRESLSKE